MVAVCGSLPPSPAIHSLRAGCLVCGRLHRTAISKNAHRSLLPVKRNQQFPYVNFIKPGHVYGGGGGFDICSLLVCLTWKVLGLTFQKVDVFPRQPKSWPQKIVKMGLQMSWLGIAQVPVLQNTHSTPSPLEPIYRSQELTVYSIFNIIIIF